MLKVGVQLLAEVKEKIVYTGEVGGGLGQGMEAFDKPLAKAPAGRRAEL